MIKYVFNLLGDPAGTLKIWATSLNSFFSDYDSKFQGEQTWGPSFRYSATNFSSITSAIPTYTIVNGQCTFKLIVLVSTTASPAFNFSFTLPVPRADDSFPIGMGWAGPKFPSGGAQNGVFVGSGGKGNEMLVERVDLTLFPASSNIGLTLFGFYKIK